MNILLIVLSLSVNQDFSFCKDKLRQISYHTDSLGLTL